MQEEMLQLTSSCLFFFTYPRIVCLFSGIHTISACMQIINRQKDKLNEVGPSIVLGSTDTETEMKNTNNNIIKG